MNIHSTNPLDPVGGAETPRAAALDRRTWLRRAGWGLGIGFVTLAGYTGWKRLQGSDEEVLAHGRVGMRRRYEAADEAPGDSTNPLVNDSSDGPSSRSSTVSARARRDRRFEYGRPETERTAAARHTNFYEFSRYKSVWRNVDDFRPEPWTIVVDGLCRHPLRLDVDELLKRFASDIVERQYRHRCVERWAMAVPWFGIPLAAVIKAVEPLASATHVRFVSFKRPKEAPYQADTLGQFPWPYEEGLTLPEATNELTFLATGMYGEPLLKQHGAPVRLVVPWKYGYKSIKSIERIEFVAHEPATFWGTMNSDAYPFESNVEPHIPRPWPQQTERMLGTGDEYPTLPYNGYASWVAQLYR